MPPRLVSGTLASFCGNATAGIWITDSGVSRNEVRGIFNGLTAARPVPSQTSGATSGGDQGASIDQSSEKRILTADYADDHG